MTQDEQDKAKAMAALAEERNNNRVSRGENFLARVRKAASQLSYLQKDGKNSHFKYKFVSEAAVKAAVKPVLEQHDLVITSVDYAPIGECTGRAAVLKCTVTINGSGGTLLSGEPGVVFTGVGAGTDSSDKAPMKACAAALKYALTSGFLIATGDDPEDDGEDETPEPKKRPAARAEKQPTEAAEGGGTDAAMKAALEIAECASVSELDAMIPELSKLKAKLAKADYETLSATFKAKKAELQEKK